MLKPLFDTHSIDSLFLGCEFTGDVETSALETIRTESKRISNRLQHKRFRRKASGTAHESPTSSEIAGYMFYSKKPDGEENEIFEIFGNRASFTSHSYGNFQSFLADALFHLKLAGKCFTDSGHSIRRIVLSYEDVFTSDHIDWNPADYIQKDTPYIPAICMKRGAFWHSSAGFFSESAPNHILHNLLFKHSLSRNEETESNTFLFTITFFHVFELHSDISEKVFEDFLGEVAINLRSHNRDILRSIITKPLAEKIGL